MSQVTLDQVRVATPCPVAWDEMKGDGTVRFCSQCSLNVYNLRDMTRDEAEDLIANTEGRICARIFRRRDGTIITRDCPVGRRALHRQVLALAGAVAAAILVVGSGVLASAGLIAREGNSTMRSPAWDWWRPAPAYGPESGDVCIAPAQPAGQPVAQQSGGVESIDESAE